MSASQALADTIIHRLLTLIRYQRYTSDLISHTTHTTGRQLGVLRYLIQNGSCTVGQISQFLYIRDATTSGLLDRMERDGYVTRHRSVEDNRKVIIAPTPRGREVVIQAPMGPIALLRARLPELSSAELEMIATALHRLSELAEVDESVLE